MPKAALAAFVGADLAARAALEPRGLFDLTDLQTAQDAHNAADRNPAVLAASAVWSSVSTDPELEEVPYPRIDSVIGTANQAAAARDDLLREEAAQADIVRDIFGNPFRAVALSHDWATGPVVALASDVYASHDFSLMSGLADALEKAGCRSDEVLLHCRGPEPHVRGCWVVDSILAKK